MPNLDFAEDFVPYYCAAILPSDTFLRAFASISYPILTNDQELFLLSAETVLSSGFCKKLLFCNI